MEATVTDLVKIEADIVDLFTGVKGMNRVYALQPERTHTPCDRNINRRELQFRDCTLIT